MSSDEATEKIEQLVYDENKIVTYKLLSTELSVHVNKAKQLLNEYITDHLTQGKNDLNVYYAVSGFQKYNGQKVHKFAIVSKNELENIKKTFSTLSSMHIYSIQKCSLNECSLYTSDYLLTRSSDEPAEFSAIRHPNLKIRESRVVRNVESDTDKKKTTTESLTKKTEQKSSARGQKTNALFTAWQKKEGQNNKPAKEQNGLPLAVSKNDDNALAEKNNSRSPQKVSKVADKGSKNNIMSLFSKQAVKSTSRTNSEKPVSPQNVPYEAEREKEEKDVSRTEDKKEVRKGEEKTRCVGAISKNKETSQKRRQKSKRTHDVSDDNSDDEWKKPKKKHRRIVAAFSDSDSESEEEKKDRAQRNLVDPGSPVKVESNGIEEDDEEPIPPTPEEEEPIPSAILASATNGKHKKLKVVNKTFEDEDGFLVTQKVKEYVTDSEGSDNEAASQVKVAPKAASKPDIKKNFVNKKQSSLMSFFKQK